jgi:putative photosynthetic complex assembly protein
LNDLLEHDEETPQGLPGQLPERERVLWRGKPRLGRLLRSGFHAGKLGVYFGLLLLVNLFIQLEGGQTLGASLAGMSGYALLAVVAIGTIALYAWLLVRASLYTITTRRVVIRTGVALQLSINLPYAVIASADLRRFRDGSGDIVLTTSGANRASYLLLWPHLRMRRLFGVQPMLRSLADAEEAAAVLGEALAAHAEAPAPAATPARAAEPTPAVAPATAPATAAGPRGWRRWTTYPTAPLAGAAALVVVSFASVALLRVAGEPTDAPAAEETVAAIELRFEDDADGSVRVYDAGTGALIDTVLPGEHGFLRATMRSLAGVRRQSGIGPEQPFELATVASGRLILSDPATGRTIDLWAFGKTNAEAFSRLFALAADVPRLGDAPAEPTARGEVAALALTQQENRP